MLYMNEWDIEDALHTFKVCKFENLTRGAETLERLADWTNHNSDGWAYWPKPVRAAKRLQELLRDNLTAWEDCTEAELTAVLVPIKSFLTRQGVDHSEVLV